MLKRLAAFFLAVLLIAGLSQAGEVIGDDPGGGGDSGTSSVSSSGGGGGSRQIDIDRLLKTVQDGKKNKPQTFEELKTILWKDPITSEKYERPVVLMYYKGNNTTVSRNEPLEIATIITNNNPLEMRRMLDLYLEVKEPGSSEYKRINSWPEKIQTNEYGDKFNTSQRTWSMLPSFAYLKRVGEVRVRANVSDQVTKWSTTIYSGIKPPHYSELVFNVTNSLPKMSNFNVTPGLVNSSDRIEYRANIEDADGDLLNVTLHILDENGKEIKNKTISMKPGDVTFKAIEDRFFTEADAGRNFTYYYSYDDGINSVSKDPAVPLKGPNIRKSPKLDVQGLGFYSESENYYWWEKYGFKARAKNLNPDDFNVTFTLYTKTDKKEWNKVGESKKYKIGPNYVEVNFNDTKPFQVTDANETFHYKVEYNEKDVSGGNSKEGEGEKINGKKVPYKIFDGVIILNLFPMLILIMLGGFFMERMLKKGVEAHERAGKTGGTKKKGQEKSGRSIADTIVKMLRRG